MHDHDGYQESPGVHARVEWPDLQGEPAPGSEEIRFTLYRVMARTAFREEGDINRLFNVLGVQK